MMHGIEYIRRAHRGSDLQPVCSRDDRYIPLGCYVFLFYIELRRDVYST